MILIRKYLFAPAFALQLCSGIALSQNFNVDSLFNDLVIAEREEAAAKEIRLKWISEERTRLRKELQEYESELETLQKMVPEPRRARAMSPTETRRRDLEKQQFNDWTGNNSTDRKFAIFRGIALNTLTKVLGPIAHYRKSRITADDNHAPFPSLESAQTISQSDVMHYHMSPATSAGSQYVVRLNQSPLELQWPVIFQQNWSSDCDRIQKLRDEYVSVLSNPTTLDPKLVADRWQLLDEAFSLLQAKALQRRTQVTRDQTKSNRMATFMELNDAVRYIETMRATASRFKTVPADFKVRTFAGGSIEDFLDFCYTHGMYFQSAQPQDEEAYLALFRKMQDYARDIQYIEDWKSELDQRIGELTSQDKKLVWQAAEK